MNREEMEKQLLDEIALRDAAQAIVDRHIVAVAKLQLDLAEAEKPELRHLDWGRGKDSGSIWLKVHGNIWYLTGCQTQPSTMSDARFAASRYFEKTGNLKQYFDDLTAQSEPLEEFDERGAHHHIHHSDTLHGSIMIRNSCYSIEEVKGYILNLQRLIFTAEQEAAR